MLAMRSIRNDQTGVGAVEFAFAFPVFLLVLLGALELGASFFAAAGLRHGLNEAARYATVYPTPNDDQLRTEMIERLFGVEASRVTASFQRGEDAQLGGYLIISADYHHHSITSFGGRNGIKLREVRKVWLHPKF